jgi:hypothetical protein
MLHQFPEHLYHLNQTIHFSFFESLSDEVQCSNSPHLALAGPYPAAPRRAATTMTFAVTGWKPLAPIADEAATHLYQLSYVEHVLSGWSTD